MLTGVPHVCVLELFLGVEEIAFCFLDASAGLVIGISEVIDGPGIPDLQLLVELPRVATGLAAEIVGVEVEQPYRAADRRHQSPICSAARSMDPAAVSSVRVKRAAAPSALPANSDSVER